MTPDTQLAVRPTADAALIKSQLVRAKAVYRQIVQFEGQLTKTRDTILRGAWELGQILNELKEKIGHGNWLIWLCSNFQELGKDDGRRIRNAERCMTFHARNPNSRNSTNFDDESVRKFMWGYIPTKERVQLQGDRKDAPRVHHLTFVNNFFKWDRQVQINQEQMPPVDVLRRELEQPVRRIKELCGAEWVNSL